MKKTLALLTAVCLLLPACSLDSIYSQNVSNNMQSSTVLIKMKIHKDATETRKAHDGWGVCSGVYIDENLILSAAHCVTTDEGTSIKQIWIKQGDVSERAVVVKVDPAADLLLLYTTLKGRPIEFADDVARGQECWVIGNPLGLVDIVTKGVVSKINWSIKDEKARFFIVDATALPGNSGGAVVDSDSRLIGILTRSTSLFGTFGAAGLGIAVDLKTIREFLGNI